MASNPFYSGSLASDNVARARVDMGGSFLSGGIGDAVMDIVNALTYNPEHDPKRQQAAYYKASAEQTAAETARVATKDSAIQQAVAEFDPASGAGGLQVLLSKIAPYIDADKLDDLAATVVAPHAATSPIMQAVLQPLLGGLSANDDLTVADSQARHVREGEQKKYDVDARTKASMYGDDQQFRASKYSSDSSASTTRRGQDMTDRRAQQQDEGYDTVSTVVKTPEEWKEGPKTGGFLGTGLGGKPTIITTKPETVTTTTSKVPRRAGASGGVAGAKRVKFDANGKIIP